MFLRQKNTQKLIEVLNFEGFSRPFRFDVEQRRRYAPPRNGKAPRA